MRLKTRGYRPFTHDCGYPDGDRVGFAIGTVPLKRARNGFDLYIWQRLV